MSNKEIKSNRLSMYNDISSLLTLVDKETSVCLPVLLRLVALQISDISFFLSDSYVYIIHISLFLLLLLPRLILVSWSFLGYCYLIITSLCAMKMIVAADADAGFPSSKDSGPAPAMTFWYVFLLCIDSLITSWFDITLEKRKLYSFFLVDDCFGFLPVYQIKLRNQ